MRERQRLGFLVGKSLRTPPPGSLVLSYSEVANAMAAKTLKLKRGRNASKCPRCERLNRSGVYMRYRYGIYSLKCGPLERVCPGCDCTKPLSAFRTSGSRVESPCRECIKKKLREHYHESKKTWRDTPASVRCKLCGEVGRPSDYYPDGRYRSGLDPTCKSCRNEQWKSSPAAIAKNGR